MYVTFQGTDNLILEVILVRRPHYVWLHYFPHLWKWTCDEGESVQEMPTTVQEVSINFLRKVKL